jgi:subtilisin family serine protease/subtilisin-like proprotein convertase family protein
MVLGLGGLLSGAVTAAEKMPEPIKGGAESNQLLVYLHAKTDARAFANRYGLKLRRQLISRNDGYVFETGSVDQARELLTKVRQDKAVAKAFNNRYVNFVSDAAPDCGNPLLERDPCLAESELPPGVVQPVYFHPFEEFFEPDPNGTHDGQWHLDNNKGSVHIDATGAWGQGATGNGVVIGVVDSGVEIGHPDLEVDTALSRDFVELDDDASPSDDIAIDTEVSAHGTLVAGLAAAVGGNGIGVTGVAPYAQIAALRVPNKDTYTFGGPTAELQGDQPTADRFADAIEFGPGAIAIKNHSYGPPSPYETQESQVDALRESAAGGMVHVASAGNGEHASFVGFVRRDASARPYSIAETITVAAVGPDGHHASYSNYGASVAVSAPSRPCDTTLSTCLPGLLTTDLTGSDGRGVGDYFARFGGTSGATPIVSGVLALAKEVRPEMDVRMAKHLLANTSEQVDADDASPESDGGWRENAAGCRFNQNYGFGLVNANRLLRLARVDSLQLTPLTVWDSPLEEPVDGWVPDASDFGAVFPIPVYVKGGLPDTLEEVGATLRIDHPLRGELEILLVSPSGTVGRMMHRYDSRGDWGKDQGVDWTFWSHAFWGERADGEWQLVVRDTEQDNVGSVQAYQLHLRMGRLQVGDLQPEACDLETAAFSR